MLPYRISYLTSGLHERHGYDIWNYTRNPRYSSADIYTKTRVWKCQHNRPRPTTDSASTTINQTNSIGREELDGIFPALEDSLLELSASNRETASGSIEALKDALAEQNPKPSIVKALWNTVKGINDGATFAKNVTALDGFIAANYPGLIS